MDLYCCYRMLHHVYNEIVVIQELSSHRNIFMLASIFISNLDKPDIVDSISTNY